LNYSFLVTVFIVGIMWVRPVLVVTRVVYVELTKRSANTCITFKNSTYAPQNMVYILNRTVHIWFVYLYQLGAQRPVPDTLIISVTYLISYLLTGCCAAMQ